ncbi:hypothetical protein T4D_11983 [Trichinella pseudospiralis]|uniref:Uncharacterized protein n=1 Tax=Trichinella pseudospiralis TaxID=6337 RepID=A0A0V1FV55_TRIPS|nr:hypothetical protein T4D_11983 [Trichinella pseudospiralis]
MNSQKKTKLNKETLNIHLYLIVSQTGLSLVRRILPSQSAHSYSACATCYISSIIRLIDLCGDCIVQQKCSRIASLVSG